MAADPIRRSRRSQPHSRWAGIRRRRSISRPTGSKPNAEAMSWTLLPHGLLKTTPGLVCVVWASPLVPGRYLSSGCFLCRAIGSLGPLVDLSIPEPLYWWALGGCAVRLSFRGSGLRWPSFLVRVLRCGWRSIFQLRRRISRPWAVRGCFLVAARLFHRVEIEQHAQFTAWWIMCFIFEFYFLADGTENMPTWIFLYSHQRPAKLLGSRRCMTP